MCFASILFPHWRSRIADTILLAVALAAPVAAKEPEPRQRYDACMQLARDRPDQAFDTALAWKGLGGGDAADHCAAAALIGLGHYADAAGRLEALAAKTKEDTQVKAGLLAHAAQAWLLDGKSERAEGVLTAALKLTPGDAALLVDRAEARAGQKNYQGAVDDLTESIRIEDRRPDAFVFRATAYRFLDKPELALADVEKALRLNPRHVDGLLERGILRRLKGDAAGARQDWLEILKLAPESPAAGSARTNLENMDVTRK
jgi:tetratricopeptide (TPR) repeat protein